jgi:hypothetical protein
MGYPIQQGNTTQDLCFLLVLATNSKDPAIGLGSSVTVTIRKQGGAFTAPVGTIGEIGNGWYKVAPNATDAGTLGPLLLHAIGTGTDPVDDVFNVVAYNPLSVANLGLSAIPTANPNASGGLLTFGTAAGQLNPSGGNVTVGGYAAGQDPATSVWESTLTAHNTGGTFGHFVQTITGGGGGAGSDPWLTTLGSYAAGTAGAILFNACQAGAAPSWFTPPGHWSQQQIDANGLTAIDTSKTFTIRNQDNNTAPTIADALLGGWSGAFAAEKTQSASTAFQVFTPGSTSVPVRTFTLDAAPTTGPYQRS